MAVTQYQLFYRYYNGAIGRCVTNQTDVQWVSKAEMNALKLYWNDSANIALYNKLCDQLTGKNGQPLRRLKDFDAIEMECYQNFQRKDEIAVLRKKGLFCEEICEIEPWDHLYMDTYGTLRRKKMARDLAHWSTITEQSNMTNPKFDMIFMYDGIAQEKGPVCYGLTMTPDYGQFDPTTGTYCYCLNPASQDKHQQPYIYYDKMKRINFDIWFEHSIHASLNSAMAKANELINIVGKTNVKIGKVVPLDKYIEIV